MSNPCPLNARASALFETRARLGLDKYGTTLADAQLDVPRLLQHLAEELADALVYVEGVRVALERERNP